MARRRLGVRLLPATGRAAFGQAKPYKIGTLQPLSGPAASGGKTALVGTQMAVDRINKMGGINGRPIELIVADYESKPDVGRRKAEKLLVEDNIGAHQGGFLSNVCLACMPVFGEARVVNMIGVCLDTTAAPSATSTIPHFDYSPSQAVGLRLYDHKVGKRWHIVYADYAGPITRCLRDIQEAMAERCVQHRIRSHGGHDAVLSRFRRVRLPLRIFRPDGVTIAKQPTIASPNSSGWATAPSQNPIAAQARNRRFIGKPLHTVLVDPE